jgi:hypothetical protein
METKRFTHTPLTESAVARRLTLLYVGHALALALFISGTVVMWSLRDAGASGVDEVLSTIYAGIAVFSSVFWFGWAVVSYPHRRHEELSLERASELRSLCDEDAEANRIVAGWLKAGYTIRLRDLLALKAVYLDSKRDSIMESLKVGQPRAKS